MNSPLFSPKYPFHSEVWIHFSRRPADAELAPMRANRAWRYTGYSRCWYAKQAPETVAWAEEFCAAFNQTQSP